MGLTGRYDFKGIQKASAVGISAALASTSLGPWLTRGLTGKLFGIARDWATNWLANHGLILLNISMDHALPELEQKDFDQKMDEALERIRLSGGALSESEKKEIDDAVIVSARKFIPFN